MSPKSHTDREYEQELDELRSRLLRMAGRVEEMIAASVRALVQDDQKLAEQTIAKDSHVNRAERDTDELCLLVLAKRQPMASDLRFITLALKMDTDLERIGDLAVNICERAIDLSGTARKLPLEPLREMGTAVQGMVTDAIDAFVHGDVAKAEAVIARDDQVDAHYTEIFRDILERMRNEAGALDDGVHILSVLKWLERIGDHATNIAEQVVFLVKGEDIRHQGKLASESP